MLKIRFSLKSSKTKFFNIVVINSKKSRDSKFIEKLGFFCSDNSGISLNKICLNIKSIKLWLKLGAIPTRSIIKLFNNIGIL